MSFAFSRLIVSGKDRASFLHNLSTNDIRSLAAGHSLEAFFCDAKAHVIAHGYILAFSEHHEIWLLNDSAERLETHLNRYIIREDVRITRLTECRTSVLRAADSASVQAPAGLNWPDGVGSCASASGSEKPQTCLAFTWAGERLVVLVSQFDLPSRMIASELEPLRILERYPVCGCDLSNEHLAPEADRNALAISYRKGCYLGQEPIARIDAMGHVNRTLRSLRVTDPLNGTSLSNGTVHSADEALLGSITSFADTSSGTLCLALLRRNSVPAKVRTENGAEFACE